MHSTALLVIVILTAVAFDVTNGFHDTANAMATSIATGALRPRAAVGLSGVLPLDSDGGAPDWPPASEWPGGRPIGQWARLAAGHSDELT